MQVFLRKHGEGPSLHSVKVNWKREGQKVIIDFQVNKRSSVPWHTDEVFTFDWSKNWGLWNKDVVEAFLQLRKDDLDIKAPYLEIQVSPLNQPFALIITEPRKTFFAPASLDFKSNVSVDGRIWTATLEVLLPAELLGNRLFGGLFACLSQNPREYYALEPNPETNPDFHRPELFISLDQE